MRVFQRKKSTSRLIWRTSGEKKKGGVFVPVHPSKSTNNRIRYGEFDEGVCCNYRRLETPLLEFVMSMRTRIGDEVKGEPGNGCSLRSARYAEKRSF